jgi:hypothetical protein
METFITRNEKPGLVAGFGQGAFLLEKRGWVDRAGGLIEVSYSASRSFRMAAS